MLALRRAAPHKLAVTTQSAIRPLSSSSTDEPMRTSKQHKARENRQRVAEGALHNATPALKGAADVYKKKGRATEGAYFVKEDRDALRKLVKKWHDEEAAVSGKTDQ